MKHYVVGIRHNESGVVRGLTVVDDVRHWVNEVRAGVKSNPTSAYAMFGKDYSLVVKEIALDTVDSEIELLTEGAK